MLGVVALGYVDWWSDAARHLALLTGTIDAVNSSLDLQEVMEAIAHEVAAALETDSAYVDPYDERTDELVLRATHGTSVQLSTKTPRMRTGEGITGAAAAARAPVMIAADAHLDPRFKAFPNLPEDDYASTGADDPHVRRIVCSLTTRYRSDLNAARSSAANSSGYSHMAK